MHCQAACEFDVTALEFHQYADPAAVHVGADVVCAVDARHPAHLDVLADVGNQPLAAFFNGLAVLCRRVYQRFNILRATGEGCLGNFVGEFDEVGILGDKVGFGIDLNQNSLAGVLRQHDAAFGSNAIGLLVGLRQASDAQVLHRGFDVAAFLGQRFLAFHHAGAGALAQFFHHACGDFHVSTSWRAKDAHRRVRIGYGRSIGNATEHGRSAAWLCSSRP